MIAITTQEKNLVNQIKVYLEDFSSIKRGILAQK